MKRLQILEEEFDEALTVQVLREGVSKAELLRRYARQHLDPLPPIEEDPIWQMVGVEDCEPADVDEVVYSRQLPRHG